MTSYSNSLLRVLSGAAALILGLLSGFFVFYTARLLYVTRGLRATRVGEQGAYVGAVVFPFLALLLGWGAWRCIRKLRRA